MAEYHLLTTWRIEAPLEEVYATIGDSPHWPDARSTRLSCGAEGLPRRLDAPRVSQQGID